MRSPVAWSGSFPRSESARDRPDRKLGEHQHRSLAVSTQQAWRGVASGEVRKRGPLAIEPRVTVEPLLAVRPQSLDNDRSTVIEPDTQDVGALL